jgi:predicted GIY-YIG superfamily endonuclease
MKHVYILASVSTPGRHYVGLTDDLRARVKKHNAGEVTHTSKFMPWRIQSYFAFSDEARAVAFEKYLKTSSGRAFSRKRL